jgi:two-component system, NarL family, nitrate/nitrite response regulator NarL
VWPVPSQRANNTSIRVVLADDHPIVTQGLGALLGTERDFQVVASGADGEQALRAVRAHKPDILVLDLHMPGKNGLEVLKEIRAAKLPTRVVLLAAQIDDEELLEAMRLQVAGVVLKEMAPRLLVQCLRKVHAGEPWIERKSAARAFEKLLRREASVRDLARLLTPREIEIVKMVVRGLRNRAIADDLSISEGTVKAHLHSAFEKLGVRSRAELIAYCHERGIA